MSSNLYSDRETRLDTVVGDNPYWRSLGQVAKEWMAASPPRHGQGGRKDQIGFNDWLERTYGFRTIYDEDGGITGSPDVRDQQKYLVFLLKYGG